MPAERMTSVPSARVIVVGNEKGGSGKSTVAMHVAVALLRSHHRVATIDLDSRQKTFTHYVQNRLAWAEHVGRSLEIPNHHCFDEKLDYRTSEDDEAERQALIDAVAAMADDCEFIVIDTPGHNSHLGRVAHAMADILITPLNDSFVDLDVLGTVDPANLRVNDTSHYAQMVEEARRQREAQQNAAIDWIVLRNRLSVLGSRNKRCVGEGLQELSRRLDFRCVEGLAERVIFREFYPHGLTALDDLDEATLGTRPTLSHATARLEIENLVAAMRLSGPTRIGMAGRDRDAA